MQRGQVSRDGEDHQEAEARELCVGVARVGFWSELPAMMIMSRFTRGAQLVALRTASVTDASPLFTYPSASTIWLSRTRITFTPRTDCDRPGPKR